MSQSQKYTIDFATASESDLQDVIIPLTFDMQQSGYVHGLAFWFEVAFIGSQFVLALLTLYKLAELPVSGIFEHRRQYFVLCVFTVFAYVTLLYLVAGIVFAPVTVKFTNN